MYSDSLGKIEYSNPMRVSLKINKSRESGI